MARKCLYLGYLWRGVRAVLDTPGWEIAAVGVEPQRPRSREALDFYDAQGLPVFDARAIRNHTQLDEILADGLDLIVVGAFGQILTPAIFDAPRLGTLNAHPSLLPRYRGGTVIEEQILRAERHGGATLHWIAEGVDRGDIALQAPIAIDPDIDDYETLFERFHGAVESLLSDLLKLPPESWPRVAQPANGEAYPPRREADAEIDWRLDAQTLCRRIQAFGWRGWCRAWLEGRPLHLRKARVLSRAADAPPGTVMSVAGRNVVVSARDGALQIIDWPQDMPVEAGQVLANASEVVS